MHNVIIDGTSTFAMTRGALAKKGTLYQYKTTLAPGHHTFTFNFSDGTGMITLPYNSVPFSGPDVYPFNLIPKITPNIALANQPITYKVTYRSSTNTPPTMTEVDIDGIAHTMTYFSGHNYQVGVTYGYTTTLSAGEHYYRFRYADGSSYGIFTYEGSTDPIVTSLMVKGSTFSPTSGTSTTLFAFQTTYTNTSGNAPTQAMLYVDKTAYPMTYVSGSYSTGALYQVQTTLPVGSHTFFTVFSDSQTSWADPLSPSTYAGPNVGAIAQPVMPGTLITPPDTSGIIDAS